MCPAFFMAVKHGLKCLFLHSYYGFILIDSMAGAEVWSTIFVNVTIKTNISCTAKNAAEKHQWGRLSEEELPKL